MMKNNGNFLFGLILIVVGAFWIAGTCGLIHFSLIYLLFRFWPVLLILAGINMIFQGNKVVMLLSVLILVAGGIYCMQHHIAGFNYCDGRYEGYYRHRGEDCSIEDYYDLEAIESARLKFNLSAGDIEVKASEDNTLAYELPSRDMSRTFNTDNDKATILFANDSAFDISGFGQSRRNVQYDFELPKSVLWDISIHSGAADVDLDFSELRVERVKIDSGASDCRLKLGDALDYSYINIDTGVSDLKLQVKEHVGLRIRADQVISDNNFDALGLSKKGNYYESADYDTADKQVEIKVDAAVSNVNIEFY